MDERRFLIVLWAWLAAHATVRVLGSPVLGVDDVEQAVFTQSLDWHYGFRQPLLYTWLLIGLYELLGPGLAPHLVLRYGLLFLTAVALHRAALRLLGEPRLAAAAVIGYTLLPLYGFGVHQGFTHTTLQSAFMALTFLAALQVLERPTAAGYGVLGLCVGLGTLSKYSFPLYAVALALAALTHPEGRARLRDRRLVLTLAAAAAMAGPFLAAAQREGFSLAALAAATVGGDEAGYAGRVRAGLASVARAVVEYLSPAWLVALALFPRAWRPRLQEPGSGCALARRSVAFGLGLLIVGVAAGLVTHVEQRWLPPALFLAPLAFACRAAAARALAPGKVRAFLATAAALAVLVLVGRGLYLAAGPLWGDWKRVHVPYPAWADQMRALGLAPALIVAGDEHLAGNLRVLFPQARVATPRYAFYLPPPPRRRGGCLLAWRADRSPDPPPRLLAFARERLGLAPEPGRERRIYLRAPLLGAGPEGPFARLGLVRVRCPFTGG